MNMPRFLTPGRVCLLVLIDLYLAEEVASSVRVDLLAFVASRIHSTAGQENVDIVEVLKHMSGDASTFSYVMSKWPSGVSGRTTYDAFLQRLWSFSGLDTLHIFFDHLSRLIASPASNEAHGKLSRASPIGQYVRRCCIEFTRLQFADFQELWQSLVRYRASTQEFWAQKNPEGARRLEVVQSQSMIPAPPIKISRNEASTQPNASAEDVDMILTLSVQHLQKLGTRLSDEMKSKLQQWIWSHLDSGVQSLQHFLSFFEHWKAGQYTMALENLHRYFDYSLNTKPGTENMRVYYQYALLHLSVLHADFDCWEESVEAMNECIATARENHDVACLNFALSWLLCLCQAKPAILKAPFSNISGLTGNGPGEQDEIAFLKAKAKETRHWSLLSGTSLEEAKLELCHNGSSVKAVEHIFQSAYLNIQHDLRTLIPGTTLFYGACLERLGLATLAKRMFESINAVYKDLCPLAENIRSICRLAYGMAHECQFDTSLQLLHSAMEHGRGVLKIEQRITGFIALVHLIRSLNGGDLQASAYYFSSLKPLRGLADPELEFEIQLREIDLLIQRQDLEQALMAVNTHIRNLKNEPGADIAKQVHFMIVKARIFSASGHPLKGFSIIIRAASMAERHRIMPTLLEALVALAAILYKLTEFRAARDILEAVLPMLLESGQAQVTAQAESLIKQLAADKT